MKHVLIMGASKGIGLAAVKQSLAAGHRVRAFARSASEMSLDDPNLEKCDGNALDPQDVAAALDGIDVVIQALGVAAGPQMVLGPVDLFSDATRILVPTMERAEVSRLICVTGFGAGDSKSRIGCLQRIPFEIVLGRAYDDKSLQERLIRESALDWVIARPGILTNGPVTGRYNVLSEPRQWRNGVISRSDVAEFLVQQIESDRYLGKTPVLVN